MFRNTSQKKMYKMQPWSDSPVHKDFRVRFFTDTNLLIYLVDNTYPTLTEFFDILKDSPFVELVSSRYVIFEFVGVRKREHYLRAASDKVLTLPNGQINFSSLIKYKDGYDIPNIKFEDVIADIQKEVNSEVEKILTEFKINYQYSQFHEDQLSPTFDVCLSSKFSNQDSLVLVSSVLPLPNTTYDNIVLLTNDSAFTNSFETGQIKETLDNHSISCPKVYSINNIPISSGGNIDLKVNNERAALENKTNQKILEIISEKMKDFFMGRTFTPNNQNLPDGVVPFKLIKNFSVKSNIYITVIGKNLDFIYTSKNKIASLQHNGTALNDGFVSPADKKINVAFRIQDTNENGEEVAVNAEIVNALRAEGNFVFIHPDSF